MVCGQGIKTVFRGRRNGTIWRLMQERVVRTQEPKEREGMRRKRKTLVEEGSAKHMGKGKGKAEVTKDLALV
jgi:hypothetical protein